MKSNTGLSLIELLIVLAISSFLVEELFTVYLQVKEHHFEHKARQEITEETRFVQLLIERAIQGSGYLGLSNWKKIPVYDNAHHVFLEKDQLFLNDTDASLPDNVRKKIKPDSQAIELRQMDFEVSSLDATASAGASQITLDADNTLNLKEGDCFIIADKAHAEISCIQDTHKNTIQLTWPLYYQYEKGAYIGSYLDKVYFIGDTGENFSNKEPIYGLYMYSENGMTEEITDLVSDWQINQLNNNTLSLSIIFTLPYYVSGKPFFREEKFIVSNRES